MLAPRKSRDTIMVTTTCDKADIKSYSEPQALQQGGKGTSIPGSTADRCSDVSEYRKQEELCEDISAKNDCNPCYVTLGFAVMGEIRYKSLAKESWKPYFHFFFLRYTVFKPIFFCMFN